MPRTRPRVALAFALLFVALGLLCTYNLFAGAGGRIGPTWLRAFTWAGPVVLVLGMWLAVAARSVRESEPNKTPALVLIATGLAMLLFGGYPWSYTPLLVADEAASRRLGTILFLLLAPTGLVLTAVGALIAWVRWRLPPFPDETDDLA
jgi:hypothetical protein